MTKTVSREISMSDVAIKYPSPIRNKNGELDLMNFPRYNSDVKSEQLQDYKLKLTEHHYKGIPFDRFMTEDKNMKSKAASVDNVLGRGMRERKPTWKLTDNMEQQKKDLDKFWSIVDHSEHIISRCNRDLDCINILNPDSQEVDDIRDILNQCQTDLDAAYGDLRRKFIGTIPQDARRQYDSFKEDLRKLVRRTEYDPTSVSKNSRFIEENSIHSITHSSMSSRSKVSKTSSKRLQLQARAASLQIEIEAKKEERMRQSELKRLEVKELERQAQHEAQLVADRLRHEAEEKTRRIKMQTELEIKRQELEDQKIRTELRKTEAELQTLKLSEIENQDFLPSNYHQNMTLNIDAPAFIPRYQRQPEMSTPKQQLNENDITNLMKTVTDSVNLSRLPLPEPPTFDGDPLQYPAWKVSFTTLIESRQIPASERIHYMKQYLKGEAREAVEALFYLDTEQAYKSARDILEERYGNQFLVAEAFRDKLECWPKIGSNDHKSLRKLADFLKQCLIAMSHIDDLKILNDCRENRKILQKLPEWVTRRWSRTIDTTKKYPDFKQFVEFIAREADIVCNPITLLKGTKSTQDKAVKFENVKTERNCKSKKVSSASIFLNDTSATTKNSESISTKKNVRSSYHSCIFCDRSGHNIYECQQFRKKTPLDRKEFIMKRGLCLGCLRYGHVSKDCKKKSICEKCKNKHPTCLHGDYEVLYPNKKPSTEEKLANVHSSLQQDSKTLQCSMTVPVYISSEENPEKEILIYALLDTQSDTTFITDQTTKELKAVTQPASLNISTMTSSCTVNCRKLKGLRIRGIHSEVTIPLPVTYTRSDIPVNRLHIPTNDVVKQWPHLTELEDKVLPIQDCEVGLLIGYNCPRALAPINVKLGQRDEPYGVETSLGWSVVGFINSHDDKEDEHFTHRITTMMIPDELKICDRNEVIFVHQTKTQENRTVGPSEVLKVLEADFQDRQKDKTMSQNDVKFLRIMRNNTHQNEERFYQMPLPFKNDRPDLPDSFSMAMKRLEHLKNRMKRDPEYAADYKRFMNKMISEGDAEIVPEDERNNFKHQRWVIPHHGVYHKKKKKLRVVFDCAARCQGTCLNDHLLQGPDLMNTLLGCLLRFRQGKIAVAGDIERMFYRFKVDKEDRNYLQFLWWDNDDIDMKPKLYRMTVHLFGATSSPGCANFALKKLASDYQAFFSEDVFNFVQENFYVDDGLFSCSSVDQASQLVEDACSLFKKANIRLHKFVSNSKAVLESIPESERANDVSSIEFLTNTVERVLGIHWDIHHDQFRFHLTLDSKPMTRRGVLSTVASIYDPLGCLAPFILLGKQILQEMCRMKCDWDDPLSDELKPRWARWIAELPKLTQIHIPRCYIPNEFDDISHVEIHHFSDASTTGYGQCSYLRMFNNQNQISCCLVLGKSRVTPLKGTTIPRLELSAALVSVKIANILKDELSYKITTEYFWTDSQIVLGYINNEEKRFHVFVTNRVSQIKNSTAKSQWHYVRSEDNPADLASRGMYPEELIKSDWFSGPKFLWMPVLPDTSMNRFEINPEDPELKKVIVNNTSSKVILKSKTLLKRLEKFSSWTRVVTAIAVIKRSMKRKSSVSKDDYEEAESTILKLLQTESFAEEIHLLKKKTLPKGNRLYKLDPFLDDLGILRVGGRLRRSCLSYNVQHPIILPKSGHLVELIIRHYHEKVAHQGRGFTVNELRSSGFWILNCCQAVSSTIYKCITCKKLRGKTEEQKMADLPNDRTDAVTPFSYCGIDCFGPFTVKERRSEIKRYGLIVVCMASRAIHIECLDDMTSDCFINALRCVIALRGPIRQIRCDQGSNFVGAQRILEENLITMKNEKVKQFLFANNCEFIMNSPTSSHMGGAWERHIRTIRSILATILHQHGTRIDTTTLRTFLYEVMAVINCRPLTAQNLNDPLGPEALTPNHLITMKSRLIIPPPGEFAKEDVYAHQRWRRVQYLAEEFWSRWRKEYLLTLQNRQKWNKRQRNMVVGDIVLLKDVNLYRGNWKLARVIDTIPDADGLVRRVKLLIGMSDLSRSGKRLTNPTILERPIHKLVLIIEHK